MSVSPDSSSKAFRRSYKACLNCRTRKVKCDGWEIEPPCTRCRRERKECIFAESRRGGRANIVAGLKRKAEADTDNRKKIPGNASLNQLWPQEVQQRFMDPAGRAAQVPAGRAPEPRFEPGSLATGAGVAVQPAAPRAESHESRAVNTLPPPTSLLQSNDGEVLNRYTRRMLSLEDQTGRTVLPPLQHAPDQGSDSVGTGALAFLARAAGKIARADQRDRIDAIERHMAIGSDPASRMSSHSGSDVNLRGIGSPAVSPETPSHRSPAAFDTGAARRRSSGMRSAMPAADDPHSVRPKPSSKLSDTEYIGENSILTESAAKKYIHLFFSTMHPYFPHIPPDLMDPDTLAGYPILLCAILTVSSRYHSLEELDAGPDAAAAATADSQRHIEIHERLWIYCQRLISQTVWAEASTRSIGTVFAFLLFTEWNPRAIHWRWSDYANADDGGKAPGLDTSDDGVAGLGAMRRSARMSWMLIGSATRLAQDMGFMENSSRIFLACHVSETFSAMNVGKRSMLSASLSEIDLDSDDDDDGSSSSSVGRKRSRNKEAQEMDAVLKGDEENLRLKTDTKLAFSRTQKAKIELLQIMSICYESLYGVKPKFDAATKRENLAVLNILSPLLQSWYKTYRDLLVPAQGPANGAPHGANGAAHAPHAPHVPHAAAHAAHAEAIVRPPSKYTRDIGRQVDTESLIFDYQYAKLYVYSLALTEYSNAQSQTSKSKRSHQLKLDELSKSSKYVELAFGASKEMIACTQRLHKMRMLKYMPVRWVTRIVRAVAFVVKCYLTMTAAQAPGASGIMSLSIIPLEEIINIIQKVAITLREASPDELHLCTRYSTILMYLCSEIRSKIFSRQQMNFDYESDDVGPGAGPGQDLEEQEQDLPTPHPQQDVQAPQAPHAQTSHPQVANPQAQNYEDIPARATTSKYPKIEEDLFAFPTDTVFDWFNNNDNGGGIGLDFVEPWTELIEQQIHTNRPE